MAERKTTAGATPATVPAVTPGDFTQQLAAAKLNMEKNGLEHLGAFSLNLYKGGITPRGVVTFEMEVLEQMQDSKSGSSEVFDVAYKCLKDGTEGTCLVYVSKENKQTLEVGEKGFFVLNITTVYEDKRDPANVIKLAKPQDFAWLPMA